MLEPEVVQGAFLASLGEVQTLMNHLGLAARSAPTAKLVFESDLRASLRRALQFGRQELVSVEAPIGKGGILSRPTDVLVAGRTKTPQLAIEIQWHPRGEDHAGFAQAVIGDVGVDLGGGDVGVAEQRLHDPQVRAALQQVGRERVAQHVRADLCRIDARVQRGLLQQLAESALGQAPGLAA